MGGVGHGCEMETSLMLHLHPGKVRTTLARRDGPKYESPYRKADAQLAQPVGVIRRPCRKSVPDKLGVQVQRIHGRVQRKAEIVVSVHVLKQF